MAVITLNQNESFTVVSSSSAGNFIYGSIAGRETVVIGGGIQTLGADFNAGGDTVRLGGFSTDYSIARSGSSIIFVGPNGPTVVVPAPNPSLARADQPIIDFIDGSSRLSSTVSNGVFEVRLGDTLISTTPVLVAGVTDPSPISVDVTATDVSEGSTITYTFTLSRASATPIELAVTARGSAEIGRHYDPIPAKITFAPGQAIQFMTIATRDDFLAENSRTITLGIDAPANVSLAPTVDLTARIFDNDVSVRGSNVAYAESIAGDGLGLIV